LFQTLQAVVLLGSAHFARLQIGPRVAVEHHGQGLLAQCLGIVGEEQAEDGALGLAREIKLAAFHADTVGRLAPRLSILQIDVGLAPSGAVPSMR